MLMLASTAILRPK
uniref:Endonuclease, putative n=1 Tax=Arundo donax TaxID=35708 RepID=A0A0A9FAR8_ARUDO